MIIAKKLYNKHCKPLDDLDFTILHCAAMEFLYKDGIKASYSIRTIDGFPVCGKIFDDYPEVVSIVTTEWSANVRK